MSNLKKVVRVEGRERKRKIKSEKERKREIKDGEDVFENVFLL